MQVHPSDVLIGVPLGNAFHTTSAQLTLYVIQLTILILLVMVLIFIPYVI